MASLLHNSFSQMAVYSTLFPVTCSPVWTGEVIKYLREIFDPNCHSLHILYTCWVTLDQSLCIVTILTFQTRLILCFRGCPVYCSTFTSILDLYLVDYISILPIVTTKMSLERSNIPWGAKSSLFEYYCFRLFVTNSINKGKWLQ